ncbi:hypothetical protein OG809_33930 [Kribbella soli]
MDDWALIRRLVVDGVPQRKVAREVGVGRSTVGRAVPSGGPPKYERAAVPTSFTRFEPAVRRLLAKTPDMPATMIAERVGWAGSISWFRDNVRRVRPEHRPVDPSDRLTWLPGDAAQCDLWFPPKRIPLEDGSKTVLPDQVISAAHFRFMVGRLAECQGFDHAAHAGELCWSSSHLAELLGQPDKRPPSLDGALTVPRHALWTDG